MPGITRKRLFQGFICLHILHQADQAPFFGSWMIDELSCLGYKLSPGTLYPILHNLESEGLISHYYENVDGKIRKYYSITQTGYDELRQARHYLTELSDVIAPVKNHAV